MFLAMLDESERRAFAVLARQMIEADGIVVQQEEMALSTLASELGVDLDVSVEQDPTELATVFAERPAKVAALLELLGLAHSDHRFTAEEKSHVQVVASAMGIDADELAELDGWVRQHVRHIQAAMGADASVTVRPWPQEEGAMRWHALLLVGAALLWTPIASAVDLELNLTAGVDLGGEIDLGAVDLDQETGFQVGVELMADLPFLEIGVGAEYGVQRDLDDNLGELDFSHLYGVARLSVFGPVYAAGRVGWADADVGDLIEGSVDPGSAWSIGGGVSLLGKLRVELLLNEYSFEVDDLDIDLDYRSYSARLVYTF